MISGMAQWIFPPGTLFVRNHIKEGKETQYCFVVIENDYPGLEIKVLTKYGETKTVSHREFLGTIKYCINELKVYSPEGVQQNLDLLLEEL